MNPTIENELRLQVMTNIHSERIFLNQPIDENISTITLQPLQFLNSIINTKSMLIIYYKKYDNNLFCVM
jgi:hypothetical protein